MTGSVARADVQRHDQDNISDESGTNKKYPWHEFDTEAYLAHNYEHVRPDDREILEVVSQFFAENHDQNGGGRGIDVGTGANLYPALSMLPFCRQITLLEYSRSNVRWLDKQRAHGWPSWPGAWDGFWQVLCGMPVYKELTDPRGALTERARVRRGDVFKLENDHKYDIGTMFFVAESITRKRKEFRSAMDHFLNALRPAAPFAIALMEHSGGYHVGDKRFPATDIGREDVAECLNGKADMHTVKHIGFGDNPVRDGYTGMLIACGRTRGADS